MRPITERISLLLYAERWRGKNCWRLVVYQLQQTTQVLSDLHTRVFKAEVEISRGCVGVRTQLLPSSATEWPTGNGLESSTGLHWLALPSAALFSISSREFCCRTPYTYSTWIFLYGRKIWEKERGLNLHAYAYRVRIKRGRTLTHLLSHAATGHISHSAVPPPPPQQQRGSYSNSNDRSLRSDCVVG